MSIWASSFTTRLEWADGPTPKQPLDYDGSHVLPGPGTARRGHIDCAYLSRFVRHNRDHPDDRNDPGGIEPYLRFDMEGYENDDHRAVCQILEADTVKALRDYLTEWLDRLEASE